MGRRCSSDEELLDGLRHMMTLRAFDARMLMAQRQGKTSFYMQRMGEEAVSCAFRKALAPGRHELPDLPPAGPADRRRLSDGRDDVPDLLQRARPAEGPPAAGDVLVARTHGFFSISGNLATQYIQAVGWAMASAITGDTQIAAGWIGDGSTAESDFHAALVFASTYHAPVILNIVNNQWAISTFQGFAARRLGHVRRARPRLRHRRRCASTATTTSPCTRSRSGRPSARAATSGRR